MASRDFEFDFGEHFGSLIREFAGEFRFAGGTATRVSAWQPPFRARLREFLGLGLREPVKGSGVLLTGVQNIRAVPLAPRLFLPGLAIVVTVLAFNFVGDGLRDAADPHSGNEWNRT